MPRFLVYLLLAALVPAPALAADYGAALEPLMEGEFALQGGDIAAAAAAYQRAARQSDAPELAERAAQVALLARDSLRAEAGIARWQSLSPRAPGLAPARLRLALLQGRDEAAGAALADAFGQPEGWRPAAAALAMSPDKALAVRVLDEARQAGRLPDRIDAWLAFGGVALRLDDKSLYGRLADSAALRFPDAPDAQVWQAEVAFERGDKVAAARAALDKALVLPDLSAMSRLSIASQLAVMGDPAAAAAALAGAGDDDRVLAARAGYLARAKDQQGLAALYDEVVARHDGDDVSDARLLLLGQLAEMREDGAAALAWYGRIRGGLPQEQARLRIAILLDRGGKFEEALALLRQAQVSESEWGEIVRDAYLLEAELLRARGDSLGELAGLNRGLSVFEDDAALRYARALAYEREDRVDEAVSDLRTLVAQQPDEPDFLNGLGYTLVDRTSHVQEGFELIQKALALRPDAPAILDSMGWALHRLGRDEEALPYLRRAFEEQHDAEVAAHLAAVLSAMGRKDEAGSVLRLAQEMDPDNPALRRALQELEL